MINLATSTTLKYHHVQLGLKFRVLLQPWEFALITTCQHIPMHIVIEMQFFNNYGFRAIALLILARHQCTELHFDKFLAYGNLGCHLKSVNLR